MRGSPTRARGALRDQVVDYVERSPGAHKAQIARDLEAGWTTIQHHVRSLIREGLLREVRRPRHSIIVPARMPPNVVAILAHLSPPETRRVLGALASGGHHRTVSLAQRLRWSRKTVGRCLARLVQGGLVAKTENYHPRFALTSTGRRAVRLLGLRPRGS